MDVPKLLFVESNYDHLVLSHSTALLSSMQDTQTRLHGLGADWSGVTEVDIYSIHPLERILSDVILKRIGSAGTLGVRWFFSRPPIIGIEFEMDLRGVRTDERLS
jgi:hypothetical protein